MIAAITLWVKEIIFVVLFASFLELLLPNSSMQQFCRVVIGLFVMLAILSPLSNLIDDKLQPKELPAISGELSGSPANSKQSEGADAILSKRAQLAKERYAKDLAKQIRSTTLSIEGVRDAKVTLNLKEVSKPQKADGILTLSSMPQIEKVHIMIKHANSAETLESKKEIKLEKIVISPENQPDDFKNKTLNPQIKEKIERAISQLYQISPAKIEVVLLND